MWRDQHKYVLYIKNDKWIIFSKTSEIISLKVSERWVCDTVGALDSKSLRPILKKQIQRPLQKKRIIYIVCMYNL